MRIEQTTRATIAAAIAPVFNQKGFAGTSIADIMAASGLGKGGVYNHFASKDEAALAAFDYSMTQIRDRLDGALEGKESAADRLRAMSDVFANPPVAGGCPILNTAVDCDDTHPALRDKAREAMDRWHTLVKGTVRKGIARGEFRPDIDADSFATLFVALLEGGIVLSRLHESSVHIDRVIAHLEREIQRMSASG
jgi:TetR/AcrR family transcriptional repressor of nem operon